MVRPNPMSGPAYIIALRNALEAERRPTEYRTPPRSGGTQISIRLDDFIFNHVEAIVEESGWNRAEVLLALVQRGLFDLYEFAAPETVEKIIQKIVHKVAPPQPPATWGRRDRMEIDIVSPTGWSVLRPVEPGQDHFLWTKEVKDHPRMGLIGVLLHCPECHGEVELTLDKLYGRHRMACTHCNGTLDLHEDTTHRLIWVGYRCLFDPDLAIEPDGVVVCLRSDREVTQSE
jgi:hypothetical protein